FRLIERCLAAAPLAFVFALPRALRVAARFFFRLLPRSGVVVRVVHFVGCSSGGLSPLRETSMQYSAVFSQYKTALYAIVPIWQRKRILRLWLSAVLAVW